MRDNSLKASVQYGDYAGTVAADHHDQRGLRDLAEKYHVDTTKYFVIGVDVHIGETQGDTLANAQVSILAVDMTVVKAGSVDYIQKYVDEHRTLPYLRFDIDASLEEVLLHFKRFDLVLLNSHITGVQQYQQTFE